MLTKEDVTPHRADRGLHMVAALLVAAPAFLIYAVLPFGVRMIGQDLNVGVLFFVAMGAIHIIAIIIAGWGAHNKFSLLGAFRMVNQVLSYEIPLILVLLSVILFSKTMSTQGIVQAQTLPFFIVMPMGFLIFLTSMLAEANRSPLDLIEADSEIVAGYMVEYSGMKFAMFFIAEYVNILAASLFIATLFLGGYRFFGLEGVAPVLAPFIIYFKALFVFFLMLWFRATFPRIRFDHLVGFAWKFLVPLSLVNLLLAALVVKIPVQDPVSEPWVQGGLMLLGNIIIMIVSAIILNRAARKSDAPALRRIAAVER
jgi:NADH-quinone oxidoreductase subunit H